MKFSIDEIFSIIDKTKEAGLEGFEYRDQDTKIKIRCGETAVSRDRATLPVASAAVPDAASSGEDLPEPALSDENCVTVDAPIVGTFYRAPAEDAKPFVSVGDPVKKGQVVGIIEAMKLMNEIEADCDGTVQEILAENGRLVEYGQPLVRISRAG